MKMNIINHKCKIACILLLLLLSITSISLAEENNLIHNGDFEIIDNASPEAWYSEAWLRDEEQVAFSLCNDPVVAKVGQNCIGITNLVENDARWIQDVQVAADTIYLISGWIKASGIPAEASGANLSIVNVLSAVSESIYDTQNEWVYVQFYGYTGENQEELSIAARIGNYGSINIGQAWFDDIKIIQVEEVPHNQVALPLFNPEVNEVIPPAEETEKEEAAIGETKPSALPTMLVTVLYGLLFFLLVSKYLEPRSALASHYSISAQSSIYWFLGAIFLARLFTAPLIEGHTMDIHTFKGWASYAGSHGLNNFYKVDFADYPPGYIYFLYLADTLRSLFDWAYQSAAYTTLIKLPAMTADMLLALLIYRAALTRFEQRGALLLALLFALNPTVFINSTIWGQIDSLLALFIVLMLLALSNKRIAVASAWFAIAVLVKPQALIFTPVLLFTLFKNHNWKAWLVSAATGFSLFLALSFPFMIGREPLWIVKLYLETLSSYAYATFNAFNIYALFGLNGLPAENLFLGLPYLWWGNIAILFTVTCAALVYWQADKNNKNNQAIFYSALVIIVLVFLLSIKMHERYGFPIAVLTLFLFIYTKDRRLLWIHLGMTLAHFINVSYVMEYSLHYDFFIPNDNIILRLTSLAILLLSIWVMSTAWSLYINHRELPWRIPNKPDETKNSKMWNYLTPQKTMKRETSAQIEPLTMPKLDTQNEQQLLENDSYARRSKPRKEKANKQAPIKEQSDNTTNTAKTTRTRTTSSEVKSFQVLGYKKSTWTSQDWKYLIILLLIYIPIAFYQLGNLSSPQTAWQTMNDNEVVIYDLGEVAQIERINTFGGPGSGSYLLEVSTEAREWYSYGQINHHHGESFSWKSLQHEIEARYIRLTIEKAGFLLYELGVFEEDNREPLPIRLADSSINSKIPEEAIHLIDEQKNVIYQPSFMNSSYFDEIYHARTAYEFIEQLEPYETTHPPLGKVILSWGIKLFGMTPFGWRFMGTLAGVLFIPIMYMLAKLLFSRSVYAFAAALLIAFDFMHFVQTRIATVDMYVVLFTMLMFYFMYRYFITNFYQSSVWTTWLPLLGAGIAFGLGAAVKWNAVYGGIGLAIILFIVLLKRYVEYRSAQRNISILDAQVERSLEKEYLRNHSMRIVRIFPKAFLLTLLICCIFFIVVPAGIYGLSYLPFLAATEHQEPIQEIMDNQKHMYNYHSELEAEHYFSSSWWRWPFNDKPVWYYSGAHLEEGYSSTIAALGNPAVWWLGTIAILFTLIAGWKRRDWRALLILVAYFSLYIPWMISPRSLTFIYHYFPMIPFVILAIIYLLQTLLEKYNMKKLWLYVYLSIVVILFVLFYPALSGLEVPENYISFLRWFDTWYF